MLIDLYNCFYKKNCIMVFMQIVSFKIIIIIIMKRGILRFLSILFLIFEKGDKQKNCPRYFEIPKYSFYYLKKGISKKTVPGILRFVSMLFLILEKGDKQKNVSGILRFISMLF